MFILMLAFNIYMPLDILWISDLLNSLKIAQISTGLHMALPDANERESEESYLASYSYNWRMFKSIMGM